MKKVLTLLTLSVAIVCLNSSSLHAQKKSKKLGIGIMAGDPAGLSFKYWANENNAFDLGLAWSFAGPNDGITIQGDYLWHNYNVFDEIESGILPLYYGIGGRMILADNDANLGVRVPIGINYLFENSKVGLFLEVAPVVGILPSTDFDANGGVGVRVYL